MISKNQDKVIFLKTTLTASADIPADGSSIKLSINKSSERKPELYMCQNGRAEGILFVFKDLEEMMEMSNALCAMIDNLEAEEE